MDITLIRVLVEKDAELIAGLIRRSVEPLLQNVPPVEREKILSRYTEMYVLEKAANGIYYIAEQEEKIVGVIGLINCEVRTFYVDPDYQGKGIGRKLFEKIVARAKENCCEKIFTESSPVAKKVYEKFGFTLLETREKIHAGGRKTTNYWMRMVL